jgi:hypothetical protein
LGGLAMLAVIFGSVYASDNVFATDDDKLFQYSISIRLVGNFVTVQGPETWISYENRCIDASTALQSCGAVPAALGLWIERRF